MQLGGIFDLPSLQSQIATLEEQSSSPDFWDDPATANKAFQRLSRLKNIIAPLLELDKGERDISELYELLRGDPDPATDREADRMTEKFLKDLDAFELQT